MLRGFKGLAKPPASIWPTLEQEIGDYKGYLKALTDPRSGSNSRTIPTAR